MFIGPESDFLHEQLPSSCVYQFKIFKVDVSKRPPFVVVDFHGHSKKWNVFMYGNDPLQSWKVEDCSPERDNTFSLLPEILAQVFLLITSTSMKEIQSSSPNEQQSMKSHYNFPIV